MSAVGIAERIEKRIGVDPIVIGIIAFFVIHMLLRLFGSSNFSVDETEAAVHTQVFRLFYKSNNPPLYDWLVFALIQLIGISLLTVQIVKTLLLTAGGIFFYLAVRPAFRHRAALSAAIVSYGATAFYGWDIFQQFSHTNALVFSIGFTLWAFMGVVRSARTVDYVWLGIALGLGVLSKYLFVLYFIALLLAAIRSPGYRPAILTWRLAITFVVGLIVVSPLLIGYADAYAEVADALGSRVAGSSSGPSLQSTSYLLLLSAEFWLPFAVILWVSLVRWPATGPGGSQTSAAANGAGDDNFYPLVRDATIFMTIVTLAAFFFLGTKISGGRYLISILSLLPLVVLAGIDRLETFPTLAIHHYWRGAMVFIVGLAVVRFLFFLFMAPPFCIPRCVVFVDYTPVVERIGNVDGKQNLILSNHVHIASNLLRQVPNGLVLMEPYTRRLNLDIADASNRNCYFIWFQKYNRSDEQSFESALTHALRRPPSQSELAAVESIDYVTARWQVALLRDRGPDNNIGVATLDSASPLCASGRIPDLPEVYSNTVVQ